MKRQRMNDIDKRSDAFSEKSLLREKKEDFKIKAKESTKHDEHEIDGGSKIDR